MGVCSYCKKYRDEHEECFGWNEAKTFCRIERTIPVPPDHIPDASDKVLDIAMQGIASDAQAQEAYERLVAAEDERDALLTALGFRVGPMGKARDVILKDAAALRPEMVRARNAERELKSDRDWDRMAAAELLRKWVRRKFGPWITWRTAWAAVDEIFPGRQALSEREQT